MTKTYFRRYPRATPGIPENAGHYPMNETPLALVRAIESFLAGMISGSVFRLIFQNENASQLRLRESQTAQPA